MSLIRLTPFRVGILNKLFVKRVDTGTLKDIAKQIDGVNWKSETYSFLQDCVRLGILEQSGDCEEENDKSKRYPMYHVNRRKLQSFWQKREEFALSQNFLKSKEKKAALLRRMMNEKIPKGSINEIAAFLEGREPSPIIINILEEFAEFNILEIDYDEMKGMDGKEKIYKVNTDNIINFWKNTEEYKLSEDIVNEEHTIVF